MSITLASDPEAEFKALTALMKDSGPNETAEEAEGEGEDDDEDIWYVIKLYINVLSVSLN